MRDDNRDKDGARSWSDATEPGSAKAARWRHRRITGAAVAVALAVALGAGLASQNLLSGAPDPATPRPMATSPSAPLPTTPALGILGRLAYEVNGDIYLADEGGQVQIADGAPGVGPHCRGYWAEGPMWSPDGRYLAYRGSSTGRDASPIAGSCDRTVNISTAAGKTVASFPGHGWLIAWSPDSTRVATWLDFYPGTRIGIFGLDGVRQALLTVPTGLMEGGDFDPVWSPDGASLLLPPGLEIPVDGSTPRQLPADDPRSQYRVMYSPDGAHVAYYSRDDASSLIVAAIDGSFERVLIPSRVGNAVWSPTGDRIAFASSNVAGEQSPTELGVVDVASGTVTPLVRGGTDYLRVAEFSPDGEQVLYARTTDDYQLFRSGASGPTDQTTTCWFQGPSKEIGRG